MSNKSTGVIFDTVIWISKIFEEEYHSIQARHEVGKTINIIYDYYRQNSYWILLDSVTSEFRQTITHKVKKFNSYIFNYLKEAKIRIEKGEKDSVVAVEYFEMIKRNPTINSVYDYFEKRGMGFYRLLDEKSHSKFISEIIQLPRIYINEFDRITTAERCVKKHYRDIVFNWAKTYRSKVKSFVKTTPGIDKWDRIHLMGAMLFTCSENKNVKFVTIDEVILDLNSRIMSYFSSNNKDMKEQVKLV